MKPIVAIFDQPRRRAFARRDQRANKVLDARPPLSVVWRTVPDGRVARRWLEGRDASEEGVSRSFPTPHAA